MSSNWCSIWIALKSEIVYWHIAFICLIQISTNIWIKVELTSIIIIPSSWIDFPSSSQYHFLRSIRDEGINFQVNNSFA